MSAFDLNVQLGGFYQLKITRPDGSVRVVADWFENLILDAGLNQLGTGGIVLFAQVGSGSIAPQVTDTQLGAYLATSSFNDVSRVTKPADAPWYHGGLRSYRFSAGTATGNLSEVGVGWSQSNGSLFSRSLIKDSNGNPTTITVLADEVLDVFYELRVYVPTVDATGRINISGIDYDTVLRASAANSNSAFTLRLFSQGVIALALDIAQASFYTEDIGSIVQRPQGNYTNSNTVEPLPYSNNSLQRDFKISLDLNEANFNPIGIRSVYYETSLGCFQVSFNPKLAKDNTKKLTLIYRLTWARRAT